MGYLAGGIAVLSSLGLLLGCAVPEPDAASDPAVDGVESPAGLTLEVDPAAVRRGGEATIRLVNRTDDAVGYNLCPAVLDHRSDAGWTEAPERPAEVCTMELRVLDPGGSAEFVHTVPAGLAPGQYRFRVGVELPLGGGRVEVASGGFRVD